MSAAPSNDPSAPSHSITEPDAPAAPPTIASVAVVTRRALFAPVDIVIPWLLLGTAILSLIVGSHLARIGTTGARIAAGVVSGLLLTLALAWVVRRARRLRSAERVLSAASFALGGDAVSRALAHAELADRVTRSPEHEGVSPALAKLHAARALDKLPLGVLPAIGAARGRFAQRGALALVLGCLALVALAPGRVVEGIDVAFAKRGKAPIELVWIEEPRMLVHPPSYLHANEVELEGRGEVRASKGAVLVVRGIPRRSGRTLMLSDGTREVPFVEDGQGGVVARWSVATDGRLRVIARFGNVVIEEPEGWSLVAILDEAPRVELEGAPKTIDLGEPSAREGNVTLRYDAWDDHGLREVHLVLRAGSHTERRVLAKLDGETTHDRGGYVLSLRDAFVSASRIPIHVAVAARDNDPIDGPKWGQSAEIILVPPVIGSAEADRFERLAKLRDRLVDALAEQIDEPQGSASTIAHAKAAADDALVSVGRNVPGLPLPSRMGYLLRGRVRKLKEAAKAEESSASATTHKATLDAMEALVVRLDEAMRALSRRDSVSIAKSLAEVAGDGSEALQTLAKAPGGNAKRELDERIDVDVKALDGGGASMRKLGGLGADLGEIVPAYLRRVARARPKDAPHAALAMADLEIRLRNAKGSFGGGRPAQSGGDAGGGGDGEDMGDESEGEKQAGDAQAQLDELTKEHRNTLGEVEDLLRAAEDPKTLEGLEEEAKKRAKSLRESVAKLPKNAGLRKGLEAAEAAAREKAEAMATSLEKLQVGDAKERGESAQRMLDEAKSKAWLQPGSDELLDGAADEVQKQLDWLDEQLKALRKAAAKKAAEKVRGMAPKERDLSRKAKELGDRSESKAPLPEDAKEKLQEAREKMDEAVKGLEAGDADKGIAAQKEAQKLLDQAGRQAKGEGKGDDEGDDPTGRHGRGSSNGRFDPEEKVDVPKADDHKGPDAFRKRVLEGLGSGASAPRLSDAIRRYAQGLIQ